LPRDSGARESGSEIGEASGARRWNAAVGWRGAGAWRGAGWGTHR
jgi:hypothetical protein